MPPSSMRLVLVLCSGGNRMHKLYTVGYADWTALALRDLVDGLDAMLVDIRMNAWSEREEWRGDMVAALFGEWYCHYPELGNANYKGGPIRLASQQQGLTFLRRQLEQHPVVLMCGCRKLGTCHRLHVAGLAVEHLGATVEHLPSPADLPPPPGSWKVLTLTQPWASLVMIGDKLIETRSWPTSYRGSLLIHAGKTYADMTKADFNDLCRSEPFAACLKAAGFRSPGELPLGAIVGAVDLTRCSEFNTKNTAGLSAQERAFGNFAPGRFGYKLENPRQLLTPIPARGYQQLWNWQETEPLVFADDAVLV